MQLSHYNFLLLLALSKAPAHGYALQKTVFLDTNGGVNLGPGTLYTCLKQLQHNHLIEPIPLELDTRRHSYRLTKRGWDMLSTVAPSYLAVAKIIPERLS